jgi:hypothetical protein
MNQQACVTDSGIQEASQIIKGLFDGSLSGLAGLQERTKLTRSMREDTLFADKVALEIIEKVKSVDSDSLTNSENIAPLLSLLRPARKILFSDKIRIEVSKVLNFKLWKKFPDGSGVRILTEN